MGYVYYSGKLECGLVKPSNVSMKYGNVPETSESILWIAQNLYRLILLCASKIILTYIRIPAICNQTQE